MTRKLHGPAGPSKQQMQMVVLALLVVVAAGVMFFQFAPGGAKRQGQEHAKAAGETPMTSPTAEVVRVSRSSALPSSRPVVQRRELAVTWPVEISRDPFTWEKLQPPPRTEVAHTEPAQVDPASIAMHAQQSLTLQAILMGSKPRALINSSLLHVGSVIGGYKLMQIEARAVVVSRQGVSVRIALQ